MIKKLPLDITSLYCIYHTLEWVKKEYSDRILNKILEQSFNTYMNNKMDNICESIVANNKLIDLLK